MRDLTSSRKGEDDGELLSLYKELVGQAGARSQFPVVLLQTTGMVEQLARAAAFPYMFEFRQGTLLCRVIYYPSLPVSIPIWRSRTNTIPAN